MLRIVFVVALVLAQTTGLGAQQRIGAWEYHVSKDSFTDETTSYVSTPDEVGLNHLVVSRVKDGSIALLIVTPAERDNTPAIPVRAEYRVDDEPIKEVTLTLISGKNLGNLAPKQMLGDMLDRKLLRIRLQSKSVTLTIKFSIDGVREAMQRIGIQPAELR